MNDAETIARMKALLIEGASLLQEQSRQPHGVEAILNYYSDRTHELEAELLRLRRALVDWKRDRATMDGGMTREAAAHLWALVPADNWGLV